jgi:glutamate-1-semialdehyde 2,1-aminomutase
VYQAGTLSGNLSLPPGAGVPQALGEPGSDKLEAISRSLTDGLLAEARTAGVPVTLNRVGSMWTLFFTEGPVFDYPSAKRADTKRFASFFHALLDRGVYPPPSQFEAAFVSLAMGERELEHTLAAARQAFRSL